MIDGFLGTKLMDKTIRGLCKDLSEAEFSACLLILDEAIGAGLPSGIELQAAVHLSRVLISYGPEGGDF